MKRRIGPCCVAVLVVGCMPGLIWAADQSATLQAVDALKAELPQAQVYVVGERVTRVYGQPLALGDTPEMAA